MAKKKTSAETSAPAGAAEPYVVLARKYRPSNFDDLIGQDAMVRTLTNAFKSGRIAQGYMLTGVRGVGKTTTARILARGLNYETDAIKQPSIDMPELGRHCADIIESRHPDVIEMDAASNTGVDNMREIIESARYKPILARTKVFIIDEVHMLSKGAFNALLKTLEEPPEHVKFIFATTEIRKVPVTVLSRCQRFDLRRVDAGLLAKHFDKIAKLEGATVESDALAMIARAAEGSVRDGLSLLDQAIAMGAGEDGRGAVSSKTVRAMLGLADRGRIFDLLTAVLGGEPASALKLFKALFQDGADPVQVLEDLADAVHLVTRFKAAGVEASSESLPEADAQRAAALAAGLSVPLLSRIWQMLLKGIEEAGRAGDPVAASEMVLIRIAYTADLPTPDDLIKMLGGDAPAARTNGKSREPAAASAGARASVPRESAPRAVEQPQLIDEPQQPPQFASDAEAFESLLDSTSGSEPAGEMIEGLESDEDEGALPLQTASLRPIRSFADIVALATEKRDMRFKIRLEEELSLVKFDPAGSIDFYLMPGAGNDLGNELREKLNAWTGRRWIVMLSKVMGEPPLGVVHRQREAEELAAIKAHPAIAAILAEFPGAKIAEVREIDPAREDETGTG